MKKFIMINGAMGIFTNIEAANEFIAGDPFVVNGVVGKYRLVEWNEVLWDGSQSF